MAEVIQADNEARQEWNRAVDEALVVGIPSEEIQEMKKELKVDMDVFQEMQTVKKKLDGI